MEAPEMTFSAEARWIWGEGDTVPHNIWRYFRRRWAAPPDVARASLLITADSRYEASLNGDFVGRGPVRGFPFAYFYDVYDITSLVFPGGDNVIGVLVNTFNDHTMSYIRGAAGLLCEVVIEDSRGGVTRIASGDGWRTIPCDAFNSHAPRISVQLGFEEQVDAHRAIPGWDTLTFDDADWQRVVEIGAVGCAPWTSLSPRSIPFLTEDRMPPVEVKAVELAAPRPGYFWNLDIRREAKTMRTGLRSAPPGERGSILFTEIASPTDCTIRVHTFPNYETIVMRVNEHSFDGRDSVLENDDQPREVQLKQGINLFMLRSVEWPSLLFEIDEALTFSAERFAAGAAWGLLPSLDERSGELDSLWQAATLDEIVRDSRVVGIPASANKLDIFALTSSQQFFAVPGGFCSRDITRVTPRAVLRNAGQSPADHPDALLHDNSTWTTLYPQPDGDVHLLIDFGRETIGYLEIDLDAPEGSIVDANCFEGIDDGGIFWMRNLRNSFRYICREGRQVFTSHERRGFRYVSFTFRDFSRPVRIRHISHRKATYPVEARGAFHCSDETLNKIWEVGAYTVQLCMLDTYVDCPGYEQVYWVGDARNSALVNGVAFGAYELTDRCVRLTGQSLAPDLKMVIPPHIQAARTHITTSHVVSGWFDEIPMWTFLWVWMAWEQYMNVGDRAALADYYVDVKECLRRCEGFLTERDLLDIPDVWNLVDWAAQDLERDGEVISNTVLMAQALDCAAQMAHALDLPAEASDYRALATRLREAVNRHGWSDQYQGYVDTVRDEVAYARYQALCAQRGVAPESWQTFQQKTRISEPTNTLVMRCNAVPPERHAAVRRFVLAAKAGEFVGSSPDHAARGKTEAVVPVGSPWFLFFTLETLIREGLTDDALTIMREQWNRMLEKGATTFWETFPGFIGAGHWSRSLCHGWSAAPAYFLSTQVLGVTPSAPGYARVRIAPQPFNLRWASGIVPTPRGTITVSWRVLDDGTFALEYDAPAGCEVEVVIPQVVL